MENIDLRDYIATETLKVFLDNSGRRPVVPLIDRFLHFLGFKNRTVTFEYNFKESSKRAYEVADEMLKYRK